MDEKQLLPKSDGIDEEHFTPSTEDEIFQRRGQEAVSFPGNPTPCFHVTLTVNMTKFNLRR